MLVAVPVVEAMQERDEKKCLLEVWMRLLTDCLDALFVVVVDDEEEDWKAVAAAL